MFLPPVISLLESVIIALLAITVPLVMPSIRFISAALAVTPSNMFNSAAVLVTPSRILSSAAVDVTPSKIFSSAAVDVTAVLLIDKASVSSVPSISTFPDISKLGATISCENTKLSLEALQAIDASFEASTASCIVIPAPSAAAVVRRGQ